MFGRTLERTKGHRRMFEDVIQTTSERQLARVKGKPEYKASGSF